MGPDPGVELTRAITGRARLPAMRSVRESITAAGGIAPVARRLSGARLDAKGHLPKAGTQERREYVAARRRIERYLDNTRGSKRGDQGFVADVRRAAMRIVYGDAVARIRRRGLRMRMRACIIVSEPPCRVHTMPAEIGGRPAFTFIDPTLATPVVDTWLTGEVDLAGDDLIYAVFIAYWGAEDPADVEHIEWLEVRIA